MKNNIKQINNSILNKIFLYFIIVLGCLTTNQLLAQNESGYRTLNDTAFKESGFWFDSTNSMFQMKYPIIRSIPPINTGMPIDILISYVYLDSLLRFSNNFMADSLLKNWSNLNDTLKYAFKYLYKIIDYNPQLFAQYIGETGLNNISISEGRYKSSLFHLVNSLSLKAKSVFNNNEKNAIFSLLFSDYIFRIKVIAIDSTLDKRIIPGVDDINSKRYKVFAYVLDTIKGKIFNNLNTEPQTKIFGNERKVQNLNFPIISFQYIGRNYSPSPIYNESNQNYIQNDSNFSDSKGNFKMNIGQDAIVFLKHTNQLFDFEYDYFDLDLEVLCSNNALPIIDNTVIDINNFWSSTTEIPYIS